MLCADLILLFSPMVCMVVCSLLSCPPVTADRWARSATPNHRNAVSVTGHTDHGLAESRRGVVQLNHSCVFITRLLRCHREVRLTKHCSHEHFECSQQLTVCTHHLDCGLRPPRGRARCRTRRELGKEVRLRVRGRSAAVGP